VVNEVLDLVNMCCNLLIIYQI